jgi:hypothetical protein
MKTVINRSRTPIKIHLPGGKTLHLGPGRTGQVSDAASERPSFQKLVKAGEIEIVGEGEAGASGTEQTPNVQESKHGHQPTTVVMPKGNR